MLRRVLVLLGVRSHSPPAACDKSFVAVAVDLICQYDERLSSQEFASLFSRAIIFPVMCELHGLRVGSAWRTDPLSVDYEIIIGSLGVRHALSGLQLGAASSPRKTVGITSVGRHTTIGSWCLVGHNWAPS
mmetsp:Transcript_61439/g.198801  ORF Transcript_61439/g.198801 Transcript_61439/m.198801 type:complete len:131 (+) Transcript_61439:530-922(+)